jgi:hypothetical protein
MGADKNFLNQYLVSRWFTDTLAQNAGLCEYHARVSLSLFEQRKFCGLCCELMHSRAHHYFTYAAAAARLPFIWAIGLYGVRLLRQKRTSPLIGGRDERRA